MKTLIEFDVKFIGDRYIATKMIVDYDGDMLLKCKCLIADSYKTKEEAEARLSELKEEFWK